MLESIKKRLLDFKTDGNDIVEAFEKHRASLTLKFKNVMKLCFVLNCLYCLCGIVVTVVLGAMGLGVVEILCLIVLCAFSACLSLLSLNRNSTVLAALTIVSAVLCVVWFLIYISDSGWRGASAVLLMALFGILHFLLSCAIALSGNCCEYLRTFSQLNLSKDAVMLNSKSLVKIEADDVNTIPVPINTPNLKDYIEEPVKTETGKMADDLEIAFKTAKLS